MIIIMRCETDEPSHEINKLDIYVLNSMRLAVDASLELFFFFCSVDAELPDANLYLAFVLNLGTCGCGLVEPRFLPQKPKIGYRICESIDIRPDERSTYDFFDMNSLDCKYSTGR